MKAFLFGILTAISLFSCSNAGPKTAGTDTGNPILTATVRDSLGLALRSAKVFVYTTDSLKGPHIVDSLTTDSLGQITMRLPNAGSYSVVVYWNDSLGFFAQVHVANDTTVAATATGLVDFRIAQTVAGDSVTAKLAQTGQIFAAGSTVRIPQGLWQINYTRFGTDSIDSLSSLQVQVGDAINHPEWLEALGQAIWALDSTGVVPHGYVALSHLPPEFGIGSIRSKLIAACEQGGFNSISECSTNDSCRVWQWESDWISDTDSAPVLAAVVTGFGRVQCVCFPDGSLSGDVSGLNFYSKNEVRLGL